MEPPTRTARPSALSFFCPELPLLSQRCPDANTEPVYCGGKIRIVKKQKKRKYSSRHSYKQKKKKKCKKQQWRRLRKSVQVAALGVDSPQRRTCQYDVWVPGPKFPRSFLRPFCSLRWCPLLGCRSRTFLHHSCMREGCSDSNFCLHATWFNFVWVTTQKNSANKLRSSNPCQESYYYWCTPFILDSNSMYHLHSTQIWILMMLPKNLQYDMYKFNCLAKNNQHELKCQQYCRSKHYMNSVPYWSKLFGWYKEHL